MFSMIYLFYEDSADGLRPHAGGSGPFRLGWPRAPRRRRWPTAVLAAPGPTATAVAHCGASGPRPHGGGGGLLRRGQPKARRRWHWPIAVRASPGPTMATRRPQAPLRAAPIKDSDRCVALNAKAVLAQVLDSHPGTFPFAASLACLTRCRWRPWPSTRTCLWRMLSQACRHLVLHRDCHFPRLVRFLGS